MNENTTQSIELSCCDFGNKIYALIGIDPNTIKEVKVRILNPSYEVVEKTGSKQPVAGAENNTDVFYIVQEDDFTKPGIYFMQFVVYTDDAKFTSDEIKVNVLPTI